MGEEGEGEGEREKRGRGVKRGTEKSRRRGGKLFLGKRIDNTCYYIIDFMITINNNN